MGIELQFDRSSLTKPTGYRSSLSTDASPFKWFSSFEGKIGSFQYWRWQITLPKGHRIFGVLCAARSQSERNPASHVHILFSWCLHNKMLSHHLTSKDSFAQYFACVSPFASFAEEGSRRKFCSLCPCQTVPWHQLKSWTSRIAVRIHFSVILALK